MLSLTQNETGLQRPQAQNLLGRFLFTGWDMHERSVSALSGGERRRLALALVVASGANLLLLDEPTNHLDLESREALEAALDAFPGTVLLVSHDRALLDAIADRTLALEDGTIRSYDGGWAEYVAARDERAKAPEPEPATEKPKKGEAATAEETSPERARKPRIGHRRPRGRDRRPRAAAGRRLVERRRRRRASPRADRAADAAHALGAAVRALRRLTRRGRRSTVANPPDEQERQRRQDDQGEDPDRQRKPETALSAPAGRPEAAPLRRSSSYVDFFVLAPAVFLPAFTFVAETAAGPWKRSGIQ